MGKWSWSGCGPNGWGAIPEAIIALKMGGGGWGWGWPGAWGWGRGWGWGSNYVNQYIEGTIIIDFLDPAKKQLFWHGQGSGFNLDNFTKREERLYTGVKEILAQYPPKAIAAR